LVFDDAQRGLGVRVTGTGGRTYLCQYAIHGHKWRVPLGSCSAVSLARAREAAAAVMGDVAKGRNPAAQRKADAAADRARRAGQQAAYAACLDRGLEAYSPCRPTPKLRRRGGARAALRLC